MSKSSIETTTNVTENYILSTSISDENIIIKVNGPSQAIKFTPQYSLRIKPETLKKKIQSFNRSTIPEIESFLTESFKSNSFKIKRESSNDNLRLSLNIVDNNSNDDSDCETVEFSLKPQDQNELNVSLLKENKLLRDKIAELEQQIALGKDSITFEDKSSIIKSAAQIKLLSKWIKAKGNVTASLLYRATTFDDYAHNFHEKCDNQGPTLIIIETNQGKIIGGYTEAEWCRTNEWYEEYQRDENAFLFNLTSKKKFKVKDPDYAIRCNNNSGPIFGDGCDLYVGDNFIRNRYNNNKNNYVNGGVTYDMQSKYELLDGDQKLEIKEMEVFQIKREDDMD